MKYLKQFTIRTDYDNWRTSENYITPNVCLVESETIYNPMKTFILELDPSISAVMITPEITSMKFTYIPGMTLGEWLTTEYNTMNIQWSSAYGKPWLMYDDPNVAGQDIRIVGLEENDTIESKTYLYEAFNCCFVAGTQITMSDNTTKSIENIQPGDKVLSLNRNTNEIYETIVNKLIINKQTTNMAKVVLKNGNEVTMNMYHPLLTTEGWKSLTNYKGLPMLTENDYVITSDLTPVEIKEITTWVEKTPILSYNLDVRDNFENPDNDTDDNYFANNICVHNADCPM